MFQRKLKALKYCLADDFNYENEAQFRSLILWLEDQRIRLYKIEDRQQLRGLNSNEWNSALQKYLDDLKCPYHPETQRTEVIDWLLGLAVRYEYADHAAEYSQVQPEMLLRNKGVSKVDSPLEKLDFNDPEFVKGVNSLAALLGISCHVDHLVTLQAVVKVVVSRLSNAAVQKALSSKEPTPAAADTMNLDDFEAGMDTGDKVLNQACKILRLLHVSELRDLQTKINEAIVAAQEVTADPKTDERLGKVGF